MFRQRIWGWNLTANRFGVFTPAFPVFKVSMSRRRVLVPPTAPGSRAREVLSPSCVVASRPQQLKKIIMRVLALALAAQGALALNIGPLVTSPTVSVVPSSRAAIFLRCGSIAALHDFISCL